MQCGAQGFDLRLMARDDELRVTGPRIRLDPIDAKLLLRVVFREALHFDLGDLKRLLLPELVVRYNPSVWHVFLLACCFHSSAPFRLLSALIHLVKTDFAC